jgi:cation transport ATPase
MDFLGLRNLTVLDDCLKHIEVNRGETVVLETIDEMVADGPTYELLSRGDTLGVFQLDGGPMRALLRSMRPDQFADICAVGPHVWYDAAVMFVFLLLAARMLEQRARAIANAQVDALARARPAFATRETGPGQRETVPLSALRVGDVACVAAGEMVPADGLLLEPAAWFDQALLTGESTPVAKQAGGEVFAGTVCRELPARLAVTGTGGATRLSQLVRLVERALGH